MKKTKIIIPALGLLVLSTAASVSGTVAWFSMNTTVTASGMQLQGKAENGIVISNEAQSEWKNSATASHSGSGIAVIPTSTVDAASWLHSSSNDANNSLTNGEYTTLSTVIDTTSGVGHVAVGEANTTYDSQTENAYFLVNHFYIKSSAEAMTKNIYINSLSVTGNTNSANFDKCFRVLVKYSNTVKVFAPFSGATLNYTVGGSISNGEKTGGTAVQAIDASSSPINTLFIENASIPAYTAAQAPTALDISVYVYFEGEDENCKSTYLAETMDALSVSIVFGTVTLPANQQNNG